MKNLLKFTLVILCFGVMYSCTDEDNQSPDLEISSPSNGDTFAVTDVIALVGRATDEVGVVTFTIQSNLGLDETITTFDDPTDVPFNVNITLDPNTTPGEYEITVGATDEAGNSSDETRTVTIQ